MREQWPLGLCVCRIDSSDKDWAVSAVNATFHRARWLGEDLHDKSEERPEPEHNSADETACDAPLPTGRRRDLPAQISTNMSSTSDDSKIISVMRFQLACEKPLSATFIRFAVKPNLFTHTSPKANLDREHFTSATFRRSARLRKKLLFSR